MLNVRITCSISRAFSQWMWRLPEGKRHIWNVLVWTYVPASSHWPQVFGNEGDVSCSVTEPTIRMTVYWRHHEDDCFYLTQNEFKSAWTPEWHPATSHAATSDPRPNSTTPLAGFSKPTAAPDSGEYYFLYLCTFGKTKLEAGQLGCNSLPEQDIFFCSKASRPVIRFYILTMV